MLRSKTILKKLWIKKKETKLLVEVKPLQIKYNKLSILLGKKAPSNKTPAFTKSTNMDIWIVGATNQLFIRGS